MAFQCLDCNAMFCLYIDFVLDFSWSFRNKAKKFAKQPASQIKYRRIRFFQWPYLIPLKMHEAWYWNNTASVKFWYFNQSVRCSKLFLVFSSNLCTLHSCAWFNLVTYVMREGTWSDHEQYWCETVLLTDKLWLETPKIITTDIS